MEHIAHLQKTSLVANLTAIYRKQLISLAHMRAFGNAVWLNLCYTYGQVHLYDLAAFIYSNLKIVIYNLGLSAPQFECKHKSIDLPMSVSI